MKAAFAILPLFFLLIMSSVAGTPWVSQTGLTEAQLQDRITRWAVTPANVDPVCISGYVENSLTRYSALWVRSTDTDVRRVLIGQTAAQLTSWPYPIGVTIEDRPDLISLVGKKWQEVLLPMTFAQRFMRLEFATH